MMSNRVKHFIVGALVILGAGILFIPLIWNKLPFIAEPLALPEKPELPGPAPFLAASNESETINQAITADRHSAQANPESKNLPTAAWAVRLKSSIPPAKIDAFVAQLQAQGYFAYAREDEQKNRHIFVGPEIKQERAQQIAVQLRDKLQLVGEVVQYIP